MAAAALIIAASMTVGVASGFAAPRHPDRDGYYRAERPQVTPERAEKIAFDKIGGGVLVKLDYKVGKHGPAKYDIHIHKDGQRYKVDVDAMTGDIVKFERKYPKAGPSYPTSAGISREKAEQIARDRANGGTIVGYKFDWEKNGRSRYDIEVISNGTKYDFKIDATTGEIYKAKQEPVRRY